MSVIDGAIADTTDGNRRERRVRLVFTTASGEPVQRSPWARTWRKMVGDANKILADQGTEQIPAGTTLHTLRHTYASLLIKHGESVKVLQKRLGHASVAVTLDVTGAAVERGPSGLLGAAFDEIRARIRALRKENPPDIDEKQ
ncbi:tyrosine-type recombinase/integrase [Streptomyces collinus]|uniref:tyrosine-type recombinase/integrase n=1 Tax=Streptomyces collinus TaxID=42684 RepID=UPI00367F419E